MGAKCLNFVMSTCSHCPSISCLSLYNQSTRFWQAAHISLIQHLTEKEKHAASSNTGVRVFIMPCGPNYYSLNTSLAHYSNITFCMREAVSRFQTVLCLEAHHTSSAAPRPGSTSIWNSSMTTQHSSAVLEFSIRRLRAELPFS